MKVGLHRDPTGYVYAIKCGGRVKIGWSKDPATRVADISGALPYPPRLIGILKANRGDEARYHARFSGFRVHGEWFELPDSLIDRVARGDWSISDHHEAAFVASISPTSLVVEQAINLVGTEAKLADAVGVSTATINRVRRTGHMKSHVAEGIERVTGIPKHELLSASSQQVPLTAARPSAGRAAIFS